jgi:ribosomal protein S18 acetylase RimI-like enzyme
MDARFTIAPAVTDDMSDVACLFASYEAHVGVDLSYQGFADEVATLPGRYTPPGGQLLIARDHDGGAIGCVALRAMSEPRCGEMKRLFVVPQGRGVGLGRALVEAMVEHARKVGYAELRLDTLPSMQDAIALYRRLGFVACEPYYAAPAGTLFMALGLEPSACVMAPAATQNGSSP